MAIMKRNQPAAMLCVNANGPPNKWMPRKRAAEFECDRWRARKLWHIQMDFCVFFMFGGGDSGIAMMTAEQCLPAFLMILVSNMMMNRQEPMTSKQTNKAITDRERVTNELRMDG